MTVPLRLATNCVHLRKAGEEHPSARGSRATNDACQARDFHSPVPTAGRSAPAPGSSRTTTTAIFRYVGRPLQPLRALARPGAARVIYIGTFAKILAPGLRLGYLVVPRTLLPAFTTARALTDRQSAGPEQAILAAFIVDGHRAQHLRRMRVLYAARRAALLAALQGGASDLVAWDAAGPQAGLHLVTRFHDQGIDDVAVYDAARRIGLQTPPLSGSFLGPPVRGLVLGFAGTAEDRMAEGVALLGRAVGMARRTR